ncbi:MAG: pentapeptide repeat-containing protein [Bacteroidota bacterium]
MSEKPTENPEELLKKIEKLEKKIASYEEAEAKAWSTSWLLTKKAGGIVMGGRLRKSVSKLLNGELSKDNFSDVLIAVLYRFTRIGIFAVVVALVPIILLFQQNILLGRQNDKIDIQNEKIEKQNFRLDQQTALSEAERRSAVILESGNVLDAVSRELSESDNTTKPLSGALIGRIIALSKNMKEYKYLDPDTDSLIYRSISPERGHLLLALQAANIDFDTYEKINRGAYFEKAELVNSNLVNAYLDGINLKLADLRGADMRGVDLWGANLRGATLRKADLSNADLIQANLRNADFSNAILDYANLRGASLRKANLSGSKLTGTKLIRANLRGADLRGANLFFTDFSNSDLRGAIINSRMVGSTIFWGADMRGSIIEGTDFSSANIENAIFYLSARDTLSKFLKDEVLNSIIWVDNPESPKESLPK